MLLRLRKLIVTPVDGRCKSREVPNDSTTFVSMSRGRLLVWRALASYNYVAIASQCLFFMISALGTTCAGKDLATA